MSDSVRSGAEVLGSAATGMGIFTPVARWRYGVPIEEGLPRQEPVMSESGTKVSM
jgi:hypothetical protein